MMDFRQITFEITRRYLNDGSQHLPREMTNKLLGFTRSRNVVLLAGCSKLFDAAKHDIEVMRTLLQVEAFFKKSDAFTEGDVRSVAYSSFLKNEKRCRITNRRLDHYYVHSQRIHSDMRRKVEKMVHFIDSVLGPYEDFIGQLPNRIRLTSGATSSRPRRKAQPYRKVSMKPICTPGAAPYLKALSRLWGYGDIKPQLVVDNRVTFVPKSWKTERTIACEPEGNLPLQLAFDEFVKERLRKFGVDLSSQLRNQELAISGSKDGFYATLDLEAASDTLAFNTVAWLMPDSWFEFLSRVRSPEYTVEIQNVQRKGHYAKFSSMGNGATFALETLVFAAACCACTKDFAVYGDDIIVPSTVASEVIALLRFFGFVVNADKTHLEGPFRESCGVSAYLGRTITPFYLRSWREILTDSCHNVNGLVAISRPGGELMDFLSTLVRERKLPLVPHNDSSLSGVFIDTPECYSRKILKYNRKLQTTEFRALCSVSRTQTVVDVRALFLWHLQKCRYWRRESPPPFSSSEVSSAVQKYVRKRIPYRVPVQPYGHAYGRGGSVHLHWWTESVLSPKG